MSTPRDPPGLLDRLKATVKPLGSPTYTPGPNPHKRHLGPQYWGLVLTSWFKLTGEVRIDGLLSVQLECLLFALVVLVLWRGPLQPPLLIRRPRKPGWS